MSRICALFGILAAFLLVPAAAHKLPTHEFGEAEQGGLLSGKLPPATELESPSAKVATFIAPDGRYLLGFAWDAPAEVEVRVEGVPHKIKVRQRRFKTERIEGLPPRKVEPSVEDLSRIRHDGAAITAAKAEAVSGEEFARLFPSLKWRLPARGRISGVFGSRRVLNGRPRSPHKGLDIAAPGGSPVYAPVDGVVVLAGREMFYTGNTIILAHGGGLTSIFAHLERLDVARGERVKTGDPAGQHRLQRQGNRSPPPLGDISGLGGFGPATSAGLSVRGQLNRSLQPAFGGVAEFEFASGQGYRIGHYCQADTATGGSFVQPFAPGQRLF